MAKRSKQHPPIIKRSDWFAVLSPQTSLNPKGPEVELKFIHLDKKLTESEVLKVSLELGFVFPDPLMFHFVNHNGGVPVPSVFHDAFMDTVVSETLPLISDSGRGTVVSAYKNLVMAKKIVPARSLPFAVDGGGDFFFCDLNNEDVRVFFFRSEYYPDTEKCLTDLGMGLEKFFKKS